MSETTIRGMLRDPVIAAVLGPPLWDLVPEDPGDPVQVDAAARVKEHLLQEHVRWLFSQTN